MKVAEHQLKRRKLNRLQFKMKLEDMLAGLAASENLCGVGWRRFQAVDDGTARQLIEYFMEESRRGFGRDSAGLEKNRTVCENKTVEK